MSPDPPIETPRGVGRSRRHFLPVVLLLLQIALTFAFLARTDRLKLNMMMDTHGYRYAAAATSLSEALTQHRTMVYPAFLRYFESGGRSWRAIPKFQAAIYFAAVLAFWLALAAYSGSQWLALAAATPLVYARSLIFLPWAQSDALAVAGTLVSFALVLLLATWPRSVWLWIGLVVAVTLTYQTRPASLFLVAFAPAAAAVLRRCLGTPQDRRPWRWALGLAGALLVPYLGYAGLRLAVVGHFGLVSFGGANLIGVTAAFIDQGVIDSLPPDLEVLARRTRARRHGKGWLPMETSIDPQVYFDQYNDNVWQIAVPVTQRRIKELRQAGEAGGEAPQKRPFHRADWVEQNRLMLELSRAVIVRRPFLYAHWVQQAWFLGLRRLFDDGWILWPLALLGLSLPLAVLGGRAAPGTRAERQRSDMLLGLVLVAGGYFVAYMMLVCLVSFPIDRYLTAAAMLLPPALCGVLFETWRRLARKPPH